MTTSQYVPQEVRQNRFGVRLASLNVWTDGKVLPAGLQRNRYIHPGNAMSFGGDPQDFLV